MTDTETLIERLNEVAVLLETEHGDWHYGRVVRDAAAALAAEKERADNADVHIQRLANDLLIASTGKVDAEAQVTALRRALSEHHAIGAMAGRRVGDRCPICKRMGVTVLLRSVPG